MAYTEMLPDGTSFEMVRVKELSHIHGLGLRNRDLQILRPINALNFTLILEFKTP